MNIGTTYKILHQRKGLLIGKLLRFDSEWATFMIEGEEMILRRGFFTATEHTS